MRDHGGKQAQSVPDGLRRARERWRNTGEVRPEFARVPGPGQESVWDYPRPPRLERCSRKIAVGVGTVLIAETTRSYRLLETASPPTFYLPAADIRMDLLHPGRGESICEWKGEARYWSLRLGDRVLENVAWSYPCPFSEYEALRDHIAFFPAKVQCSVDGRRVSPQPGQFYGGWVTPDVVGPFKGEPGTESW